MKTQFVKLALCLAVLGLRPVARAQFSYITNHGAITITGYNTAAGPNVVIPASINGYSVVGIGYSAFSNSSITNLLIPNSVTNIGANAFAYCYGLTTVTFGNSVNSIGDFALGRCSGLTNITVSASNPAYSSANGVLLNKAQTILIQFPGGAGGTYTIPNSVISIGHYAFEYCSSPTSVTIPNRVARIGDYAFDYCSGLTSVTIPNSVLADARALLS